MEVRCLARCAWMICSRTFPVHNAREMVFEDEEDFCVLPVLGSRAGVQQVQKWLKYLARFEIEGPSNLRRILFAIPPVSRADHGRMRSGATLPPILPLLCCKCKVQRCPFPDRGKDPASAPWVRTKTWPCRGGNGLYLGSRFTLAVLNRSGSSRCLQTKRQTCHSVLVARCCFEICETFTELCEEWDSSSQIKDKKKTEKCFWPQHQWQVLTNTASLNVMQCRHLLYAFSTSGPNDSKLLCFTALHWHDDITKLMSPVLITSVAMVSLLIALSPQP